jgi:hypothetical protein
MWIQVGKPIRQPKTANELWCYEHKDGIKPSRLLGKDNGRKLSSKSTASGVGLKEHNLKQSGVVGCAAPAM